MRFVVIGAGGVGGYFGACLARAGESVTFVARGAHLRAIRAGGLRIRSTVDGEWVIRADAREDLDREPPADVVLLTVKSFDTEEALGVVTPVLGRETAVLSLQNGVDAIGRIDAALGPGRALGAAAYVFAAIAEPGVIVHRFNKRIAFCEPDGRATARVERIRDAFTRAGVLVDVATDIRRVLWEKYVLICAQAGMTALARAPIGVVRETPETWRMYRLLLEELAAVGARDGVELPPDIVDRTVKAAEQLAPELTSSLHDDLVRGKKLELEALQGHAVRLGEKYGVPTPMLSAVYAALKPHVDGVRS